MTHRTGRAHLLRSGRLAARTASQQRGRFSGPTTPGRRGAEIPALRTAYSRAYRTTSGSIEVERHSVPVNRHTSGGWLPIETALQRATGSSVRPVWRGEGDSWQVSLAPTDTGAFETIGDARATVGFAAGAGSRPVTPVVSGTVARYEGVFPHTTIIDTVRPDAVVEQVQVDSPAAPSRFEFHLSGATAAHEADGSVVLRRGHRVVGRIPAPTVERKAGLDTSGATPRLTLRGSRLTLSVSPTWLSAVPAGAFPIVIDPTYEPSSSPTAANTVAYPSSGAATTGKILAGKNSAGTVYDGAAYLPVPSTPAVPSGSQPWQLVTAYVGMFFSPSVKGALNATVRFNGTTKPASYSAVGAGTALGTATYAVTGTGNYNVTKYLTGKAGGWFGLTASGEGNGSIATVPAADVVGDFIFSSPPPNPTITAPTEGTVVAMASPTFAGTISDKDICDSPGAPNTTDGPVFCDYAHQIYYDFKVTTAPHGGQVAADSGWLQGPYTTDANTGAETAKPPTWTAPAGALTDGATYYVSVQSNLGIPGTPDASTPKDDAAVTSFKVKLDLDAGGPSPVDTVGSVPGGSDQPSKGAPSPGTSPSSETVDMITGNVALKVGLPHMTALGGSAGIDLSYNSTQSALAGTSATGAGNYGLLGQYYNDASGHTYPTTPPVGQRIDASVNATGSYTQPPIGGIAPGKGYLVRWTGQLTLPATASGGYWLIGGETSGGYRVYTGAGHTLLYNDWSGTTVTANTVGLGTTQLKGASSYPVEVNDWDLGDTEGPTSVQLWVAKYTPAANGNPATTTTMLVPSSWLTPSATGLPPGWAISVSATALWNKATDLGDQVVLHAATGVTESFTSNHDSEVASDGTRAPGTYRSPAGSTDLLRFVGGHLQLSTNDGYEYVFNTDGTLSSVFTSTDDRHADALQYTYSPVGGTDGAPITLHAITDPVSQRQITLTYGGEPSCPTPNQAPQYFLCSETNWDATTTNVAYNANGQLAAMYAPGGNTTLFGWDTKSRLAAIRDPLANDYVQASRPGSSSCSQGAAATACPFDTAITYDTMGRASTVTQPAAENGTARQQRTYVYAGSTAGSGGTTTVRVAGFSPAAHGQAAAGAANTTMYDGQGRIVEQVASGGLASYAAWNKGNLPIVKVDGSGQQISTVYDLDGLATDVYGPAPTACFDPSSWPSSAQLSSPPSWLSGYLPLANPSQNSACGTDVPHSSKAFDEGMPGLAATYWSNGDFAGAASSHATGIVGYSTGCSGRAWSAGAYTIMPSQVCGHVPGGAVTGDSLGNYSVRQSGLLNWTAASGQYYLNADLTDNGATAAAGKFTLRIDGVVALTNVNASTGAVSATAAADVSITTGSHHIELDLSGNSGNALSYALFRSPDADGQHTGQPASFDRMSLDPEYGLQTSSVDADGKKTSASYGDATTGPEYGLVLSSTVDPAGSALTTRSSYEAPGANSFQRKLANVLPSGATTSYTYYGGAAGPLAAVCNVASSVPQGGRIQQETDPAPDAAHPGRVVQFVYDAAGRQAGRRVGSTDTVVSEGWECSTFDTRGRPLTQTWPATVSAPARRVTYSYALGGDPLTSAVMDSTYPQGDIESTVDLLGRVVSYTDSFGAVTTTQYNQIGQIVESDSVNGQITSTFDANTGLLSTVSRNGATLATEQYDPANRLTAVDYGNGTKAVVGYDALGRQTKQIVNDSNGGFVTGYTAVLSLAGRSLQDFENLGGGSLQNPAPANDSTYRYDGAGRLTSAWDADGRLDYDYSASGSADCAFDATRDDNRARTSLTTSSGATSTTSWCYDHADRLVSSNASSDYSYDARGNNVRAAGSSFAWDASDRVVSITAPDNAATTYTYDALDRVIATAIGGKTTMYTYAGMNDTPVAVRASDGSVQQMLSLPGNVNFSTTASGTQWAYADLHSDVTIVAGGNGAIVSGPETYDPWGTPTAASSRRVHTINSDENLEAFGGAGKLTDDGSGITIMGARPYLASEARFLSVDPVTGGCANPYTYVFADPVNHQDLTGRSDCGSVGDVVGFLAGAASAGLGIAALFASGGGVALALGAASVMLGAVAAGIDAANCIKKHDAEACAGAGLGLVGAAASGAAILLPAGSAGAALGTGFGTQFGLASFAADFGAGASKVFCALWGGIESVGKGIWNAGRAVWNWLF